jgi:hypothetical protein
VISEKTKDDLMDARINRDIEIENAKKKFVEKVTSIAKRDGITESAAAVCTGMSRQAFWGFKKRLKSREEDAKESS